MFPLLTPIRTCLLLWLLLSFFCLCDSSVHLRRGVGTGTSGHEASATRRSSSDISSIGWNATRTSYSFASQSHSSRNASKAASIGTNIPATSSKPVINGTTIRINATKVHANGTRVVGSSHMANRSSYEATTTTRTSLSSSPSSTLPSKLQCNASDHQLTPDQWEAFAVNDFLDEVSVNWTASKTPSFWDWFIEEYVGEGFATVCTVDQDNGCGPLTQSCETMKPGPWSRQAYLLMAAMMTYSRYLHFAYQAYGQSGINMGHFLPNWETFFDVPQKTQSWQNVISASATAVGLFSTLGFLLVPFTGGASEALGITFSATFSINSILNNIISWDNVNGAGVAQEVQFDNYAQSLNAYTNMINASQQALVESSNAVFQRAVNLTTLFKDGHFVGDNIIKSSTDSSISGAISQAATWLDHVGIWGLINQAWKLNNNYIVFIPYGPVKWYGGKKPHDFQQPECESHFLHNKKWNSTIYAACDLGPPGHAGMAMFMVPQNNGQLNTYNRRSFYDVTGYTVEGYTFTPRDVLLSSLTGYFQYGYDYNATTIDITASLANGSVSPLQKIAELKATDPGVFNLAVCQIWDTNYIPACTITDYPFHGGLDPCISQPAVCATTEANWTDPVTGRVQFFRDHVSKLVVEDLGMAQGYNSGIQ